MTTWSIYHKGTGLFTGRTFTGPHRFLEHNLPEQHGAVEGVHDHLSKKVHLETGEIHEHQPPQPSEHHIWHHESKRWVHHPDVAAKLARREEALQAIKHLESSQPRALREVALGLPGGAERLAAIESKIATLRQQLP